MKRMPATPRRSTYKHPVQPDHHDIPSSSNPHPPTRFFLLAPSEPDETPIRVRYSRTIYGAIRKTYGEFCEITSIHGVQFLREHRFLLEKILWGLICFLALINCIYRIWEEYDEWRSKPIMLHLSDYPVPASNIPFPAITICHENKFMKNKTDFTRFVHYMDKYVDQPILFEPPPWLSYEEFLQMRSLLQICGKYVTSGVKFPDYKPLDVNEHLDKIVPPFESTFIYCWFNSTKGSCGPFFEKIYTESGICYSFNALNQIELYRETTYQHRKFKREGRHLKERKKLEWAMDTGYRQKDNYDTYPRRVFGSEIHAGLLVVLQGFEDDIDNLCRGIAEGFKVVLHSPDDIPQVDRRFVVLPYDEDIVIMIEPHITLSSKKIRDMKPERKQCYYPNERYLRYFNFYTQNNCELECLSNYTYSTCGCVHFSMPRDENMKVCDANEIVCYNQVDHSRLLSQNIDTQGEKALRKCNCLPSCWSLVYHVGLSRGILNMKRIVKSHSEFVNKSDEGSVSRLTTYFRANAFLAMERTEFITLAEFISHSAGILGLFLSVTAINFIQLLYHWTINLSWNIRNRHNN